jgi:hypothetical protein
VTTSQPEIETKYDVRIDVAPATFGSGRRVARVTAPRTYRLQAVYFDPVDVDLLRAVSRSDAGSAATMPYGTSSSRWDRIGWNYGRLWVRLPRCLTR